jgi:gliding motility-associated-like protein
MVLDSKNGLLLRSGVFETINGIGLNFVYDSTSQKIRSLIGNDSALLAKNGGNSLHFNLRLNGTEINNNESLYGEIAFGLKGASYKPLALDHANLRYVSANEKDSAYSYLFCPAFTNNSKFSDFIKYPSYFSVIINTKGNSKELVGKCNYLSPISGPFSNQSFIYTENNWLVCAYSMRNTVYYSRKNVSVSGYPFLPNAFSPNNDGVNDSLHLGYQNLTNPFWQIFNRQGQLIYSGSQAWNGTFKGGEVAQASYFFILTGVQKEGSEILRNGIVNLVR